MALALRHILFGPPIPTERAHHERLNNVQALAVFASDAISSTAYATQEILLVLTAAGQAALHLTIPVGILILLLLLVVMISYRQTIFAYPNGGGSYIVARDNLGVLPAQIAGASLLTDYVLTVSVSISAGIAAITSAFPALHPYTVLLCLLAIGTIAWGNLRGIRESGTIFAIPTYFFIGMAYVMLGCALFRYLFHEEIPFKAAQTLPYHTAESIGIVLILRAFASGCAALTGVEAISDGIPAFRPPESKNASRTLVYMGAVLATIFFGITWFVHHYGIIYTESSKETVLSMLAGLALGRGSLYFLFQLATMGILIMAANTSYSDFPRLAFFMAQDGFLPRQMTNLGERLVFNNGILTLTVLSSILLVIFKGDTDRLIPLYAVGVFLSFTLSQSGMVRRWNRLRTPGWRIKALVNGMGALTTGIVACIIASTKFVHGAWVVTIIIPCLVLVFFQINRHYQKVTRQLKVEELPKVRKQSLSKVLVLVPGIHKGAIAAIEFAQSLSDNAIGIHIDVGRDAQAESRLKEEWESVADGMPLIVVHSPYREVVRPIMEFIDQMKASVGTGPVTVVLPEFVPKGFLNMLLHNQTGLMIKWALLFKRDVVLCNVRYYLD
jgi:amino acid transporter